MSSFDVPEKTKTLLLTSLTGPTPTPELQLALSSTPKPSEDEHIIRVHSTAVTNGELAWSEFTNWPTQHVPCYDVVGTVLTEVAGSPFNIGDVIYGRVEAHREGTAREYATILPLECALIPQSKNDDDAFKDEELATVPMSAETAWQGLFVQAGLTPPVLDDATGSVTQTLKGKRILITAASGGVGIFAVQIAKLAGAHVVGTCSERNREFVLGLGADEVIDYTKVSVPEYIASSADPEKAKFDVILECTGYNVEALWSCLAHSGTMIGIVPGFKEPEGGAPQGTRGWFFIVSSNGEQLNLLSKFIEHRLLHMFVDSVWELEKWKEAFERSNSGRARGKVVFRVN